MLNANDKQVVILYEIRNCASLAKMGSQQHIYNNSEIKESMKIGIIGSCGIVGSSTKFGFEKLGHEVIGHDAKLSTKLSDITDTEMVFICVPTPKNADGSCHVNIVESVIDDLFNIDYSGLIVIKSTITPGTTERLKRHYKDLNKSFSRRIVFCGEYSRERCAVMDFVENNKLLAVGTDDNEIYEKVKSAHGHYPKNFVMLTATQCEVLKYMNNLFGALRVVFANEIKDLCDGLEEEYTPIKNAFLKLASLPDIYFDVNDSNCRSYSSICWNKDIPAIVNLADKLNINLPIINNIETSNNLHKKTPFGNTRE